MGPYLPCVESRCMSSMISRSLSRKRNAPGLSCGRERGDGGRMMLWGV